MYHEGMRNVSADGRSGYRRDNSIKIYDRGIELGAALERGLGNGSNRLRIGRILNSRRIELKPFP